MSYPTFVLLAGLASGFLIGLAFVGAVAFACRPPRKRRQGRGWRLPEGWGVNVSHPQASTWFLTLRNPSGLLVPLRVPEGSPASMALRELRKAQATNGS